MNRNSKHAPKSYTEFAIAFELVVPSAKFFVCASTPGLRSINEILNLFIAIVFVALFFLSFHRAKKNKVANAILIIGMAVIVYILNFLLYSNARQNLSDAALKFFGISILMLILSVNLDKVDELYKLLTKGSYLIVLSELIFLFFDIRYSYSKSTFDGGSYSLALSNFLIMPLCLLLSDYLRNKKKISLMGFLISLGVGGVYGSRSFILSVVLFCLLYYVYIINKSKVTKKLALVADIAVIVGIVVFLEIDKIKEMLLNLYYALGINSRSLHMLLVNSFYVSGRDYIIFNTIIPAIKKHPLVGNGLLGVLGAHNIVFEALVSHGIIFGSLLIISLILIFLRKLKYLKNEDIEAQIIFLVMFSYASVDAMTHLTVIGKDYFWVALGLCFVKFQSKVNRRIDERRN